MPGGFRFASCDEEAPLRRANICITAPIAPPPSPSASTLIAALVLYFGSSSSYCAMAAAAHGCCRTPAMSIRLLTSTVSS